MTRTLTVCPPCADALMPAEHGACLGEGCACTCRLPKPKPVPEERTDESPRTDLDHVGVGWYVQRRSDSDREPPGGVVMGISHYRNHNTGEHRRRFRTATAWGPERVRWDYIRETDVGQVSPPDRKTLRDLWRALAALVAGCKGIDRADEREWCELIAVLARVQIGGML